MMECKGWELLLTFLSAIVCVRSNVIPAVISPVHDCKGLKPNCNGAVNAMHSVMVRILSANHEYGKGIHSLHKLYNQLNNDFAHLKNQLNSLEKKFVQNKLQQTNEKHTTSNKIQSVFYPSPDLQVHGQTDHVTDQKLEDLLQESHIWSVEEFNSFQTLFINITTSLRTQGHKASKLLKRVNSYRKDVKKYTHLVRHLDKKLLHHVDKITFEENSKKQKAINSKLESRVSQIEQLLNKPDVMLQNDGRSKDWKHIAGCPPGFREYMSSCYHFSNDTLNWIDAEKQCQQRHHTAHLVAVESQLENDYILQYRMYNTENWSSDFIWLGGLDISGSGKWTWAGTQKPILFSLWKDGAQHQSQSNSIYNHDCIYTQAQLHSQWNKWNCFTARLNFVCEI